MSISGVLDGLTVDGKEKELPQIPHLSPFGGQNSQLFFGVSKLTFRILILMVKHAYFHAILSQSQSSRAEAVDQSSIQLCVDP